MDHPPLHLKFEACLGYMRPRNKRKQDPCIYLYDKDALLLFSMVSEDVDFQPLSQKGPGKEIPAQFRALGNDYPLGLIKTWYRSCHDPHKDYRTSYSCPFSVG